MMYDQLKRVNQIDREITDLHAQLGALYQERQTILNPPATVSKIKFFKPLAKKKVKHA